MNQAKRLMVMGGIDVVLGILFGIFGDSVLRHSDVLIAMLFIWLSYNLYELFLPRGL